MLGFRRRKSPWQDVDYMALVPAHNLPWFAEPETDTILVQIPRYSDPIFGRLLQPRLSEAKKYIKVPLESRGAFLWRLMDGQRTVADLVRAFEAGHSDDAENAPKRISMYLHAMYDNKFIKYLNL
jgi:hypothetical protein